MSKQSNRYEVHINELNALKRSEYWGNLSCHTKLKISTALKLFEEVLEEIKEKEDTNGTRRTSNSGAAS